MVAVPVWLSNRFRVVEVIVTVVKVERLLLMFTSGVCYLVLSSLWERVSGTPAPGDGGPLRHGYCWLPGYSESSRGGDPGTEGGDGEALAGVPGPPQCQAGPGYRDRYLQEAAGGRGEQVSRRWWAVRIRHIQQILTSIHDIVIFSLFLQDHHSSSELFQPAV